MNVNFMDFYTMFNNSLATLMISRLMVELIHVKTGCGAMH